MAVTLTELAIEYPAAIELFEKYNLDYYQNGKQNLQRACKASKVNFTEVEKELNAIIKKENKTSRINMGKLDISQLLYYINGEYHSNEDAVLTLIHTSIQNVLKEKKLDKSFTELVENIEEIFIGLKNTFNRHCHNEENILFPYAQRLLEAKRNNTYLSNKISLLKNPVVLLETEHLEAAAILSEIKIFTHNFFIPGNAPPSFRTMMNAFLSFERDFHNHLHIENNILFPKLIALEEELNTKHKVQ